LTRPKSEAACKEKGRTQKVDGDRLRQPAVFSRLAERRYHKNMAKNNIRFTAVETVTKPATVRYKTKSGGTVSFKALKTFRKKEAVHSRAGTNETHPSRH
jgi:hypothetical protein